MSAEQEQHKSMIDDSVRPGAKTSGKMADPKDALKTDDEGPKTDSNEGHKPEPHGAGSEPTGANVTGDHHTETNKNPMSNSGEPNDGFGGHAGIQPSVSGQPDDAPKDSSEHQTSSHAPSDDKASAGASDKNPAGDDKTAAGDDKAAGDKKPAGDDKPAGGAPGGGAMGGVPGADKLDNESHGEGTGTKYIKSTGLQADGGDFDAARAGAGREADRLLEEKGIHHGPDKKAGDEDDKDAADHHKKEHHGKGHHDKEAGEKKGLGEKIKEKLAPH